MRRDACALTNVLRRFTQARSARAVRLGGRQYHRSMSASIASSNTRLQLILDFDGTITKNDTTAIIGSRCLYEARRRALPDLPESKLPQSMQYYSERYMTEYREWQKNLAGKPESQTINDEIDRLSASRHVEQESFMRVRDAILSVRGSMTELSSDVDKLDSFMTEAGRQAVRSGEVEIRDPRGLKELLSKAVVEGNEWGIVSVSWSQRFIMGVLLESKLVSEQHLGDLSQRIRCNELLGARSSTELLCSARDKLASMKGLLAEWDHADLQPALAVYIGDSTTDLGCLTGPAVGMYMQKGCADGDKVLNTLSRLGIAARPVAELPDLVHANSQSRRFVGVTRGFEEVNEWLTRCLRAH